MKHAELFSVFSVLIAATAFAAAPRATVVGVAQDAVTRRVTVSYKLDAPAIVTTDFVTNGVSVGAGNFRTLAGDINRYVVPSSSDEVRSFTWQPGVHGDWNGAADDFSVALTAWSTNCPPDYMVVDLFGAKQTRFYVSEEAVPEGIGHPKYKSDFLLMRKIPAEGVTFRMGTPEGSRDRVDNEVAHLVTLKHDFYLGVYPFTQRQWVNLCNANPSSFKIETSYPGLWEFPEDGIPYDTLRGSTKDGIDFPTTGRFEVSASSKLQALRDLTGISTFDLPTEAEWEYACRAGTGTDHYDGSSAGTNEGKLGWYGANSPVNGKAQPHPVGLKMPNGWGLYDTLGNMHEWCIDWFGSYEFSDALAPVEDPKGPKAGTDRVKRGGASYEHRVAYMRAGQRDGNLPNRGTVYNGFRAYCSAVVDPDH